ncbi:hypothetical protein ACPB9J_12040 [Streptomyces lavendulocolor]|uniref:hypothetical protein n=1 Tax=Streptomyces lavendulocolor TaxID=67316 RepID=UPI003C2D2879
MNLRATVLAVATGALLTTGAAGAAGSAAAQAAGHEAAPGTGAGTGSDSVAIVKNDRLTPSSVVGYVLDTDES